MPFSAAFKKFHGATPSEVRNGKPYRVFPRLQLSLKLQEERTWISRFKRNLHLPWQASYWKHIDNSQCPSAWEQLYANHSFESLESLGSGQSFGVCSDVKEGEIINYMAAYDVADKAKAEELGLSIKEIAEAEYAIVPVKGGYTSQHPPCLEICLGSLFPRNWLSPLRSTRF